MVAPHANVMKATRESKTNALISTNVLKTQSCAKLEARVLTPKEALGAFAIMLDLDLATKAVPA